MGPGELPRNFTRKGKFRQRMDLAGFEPATSSVRLKRAPNCATGPELSGMILNEGSMTVKQVLIAREYTYTISAALSQHGTHQRQLAVKQVI